MEKNRTVQRGKGRKKGRPKVRFRLGTLMMIFILSFAACFVLYMSAANLNDNFLNDEFGISTAEPVSEESEVTPDETSDAAEPNSGAEEAANPVPQSAKAENTYFDNCCLITDSTLAGMNKGFGKDCIFGGNSINTSNVMSEKLESSFGSLSAYDIVKNKKPQILYIMLGSELGTASADDMIAAYTNLVSSLSSALPDMKIYVMQYPPVIYDSDTLTNEIINDYNNKLLMMCDNLGIYCIDTNTALKSEDGKLQEEYWSYELLALSEQGYDKIIEYILTHTA
ncbi:MAG: hypothetical protein J6B75_08780 [Ruminococcus sp.]|nr:hypothetical protein [Ruminococcus sp.]